MPQRLERRAEEIMSPDVLAVPANAPIREVVRAMVNGGNGCVVDQGRPVGIVLEWDPLPLAVATATPPAVALRKLLHDEAHILAFVSEMRKASASLVGDVMESPVQSVEAGMTLVDVAAVLEIFGYGQVPMVRDGLLVGLITCRDIVRALAEKP
ncbi:MAG: CBS domain-containing protein [Chloroflexi bacterium]|nr:CBS domain-containing protein [Chloroflexota bacterium]